MSEEINMSNSILDTNSSSDDFSNRFPTVGFGMSWGGDDRLKVKGVGECKPATTYFLVTLLDNATCLVSIAINCHIFDRCDAKTRSNYQ